ncbi:unnamed protein product [Jaminaea pallidilutea]
MANTWAPVGSPSYQHHPIVPVYDSEIPDYAPPSPTPSRESRRGRISQWFSRSRSPSRGGDDPREGGSRWGVRSRSRGRQSRSGSPMDTGSPSSFVVRNVVRQSGGVSGDESEGEQAAQSSKYRRTKSKPLSAGAAMSLGVPPGGPGGGTGYGTATSSNDGRPIFEERNRAYRSALTPQESESADADSSQVFPPPRPASPATTKASAFRQSRSPRRSPIRQSFGGTSFNETDRPSASALREAYLKQLEDEEAAQSTDNDGASSLPPRTGSPTRSLIGGPRSLGGPAGGRPLHLAFAQAADNSQAVADSPDLGAIPGFDPASFQTSDSSSPLNVQRREAEQAASAALAQGDTSGIADRLRGFFTGPSARSGLAVAEANHEDGRELDEESAQGEALPYGMPRQAFQQQQQQQRQPRRSNISGALRKWSGQMGGQPNAEDEEAEALRRRSRQEAARLVDEERRRVMAEGLPSHQQGVEANTLQTDSQPSELAGRLAAEGWTADMLEQLTDQGRRDLVRRLTARSEASSRPASSAGESATEEIEAGCDNLTAAQRIIADTRERHLEEERRASTVTVMADEPRGRQVSTPPREVPVRRRTSPKKKPPMQGTAPETNGEQENATARGSTQPSAMRSPTATPAPRKANAPGQGPLPMDFGPDAILPALQDMMTRFYRFERYCVPLLRTLDARYGEVQGAVQGQGVNNEWLEHVSTLMKHEIGQLRAAAGELHQGRQALDALVKLQQTQHNGNSEQSPAAAAAKALDRPASPPARSNLALPAGAAPALDKDGSSGPTQSSENASRRMRSTSPNGRPKYTSALGQPLVEGRISPAPSQDLRERRASIAPSIAPSVAPSIPMIPSGVSLSIEADDDDSIEHHHQHQQQEAEQAVSQRQHHSRNPSHASVGLSIHTQRAMARAAQAESLAQTTDAPGSNSSLEAPSIASPASPSRSVNDRLKALMGPRQSQRPQEQFEAASPGASSVNAERWSPAAAAPITSHEEPAPRPRGVREGAYLRPASPHRSSSQAASPTASVQEAFVSGRNYPAVGSYAGSAAQSSTRTGSGAASARSHGGDGSPALNDDLLSTSATANAAATLPSGQASRDARASTKSHFDSASSRSQDSYSSQSRVNGSRAAADRENNKPSSLRAGWTPSALQTKASPAFSGANKGTFAGTRPGMTMKERVAFFEIGNR